MSDLFEVADLVLEGAEGDEQVEAFVTHSRETQVRVYEGEVEHLAAAEALGVGVRVVKDGRLGFAYCGTFDPESVREALSDARDNAAFAEPDEWAGLGEPDGVEPAPLDLWRDDLLAVPTDQKVALVVELERAVRAADPRIVGVESCDYADSADEAVVATTTGIRRSSRSTGCELVAYSLAAEGDETQTGFGFSTGRTFSALDPAATARDAADRATRMLGAVKPASVKTTVVLDPWVAAQLLGMTFRSLRYRIKKLGIE